MSSRYGQSLFEASSELLSLFALDKSGNRTGVFPYGQSEEEVTKIFQQACDTRENYLKFVELYKRLVNSYEFHIKCLKAMNNHFSFSNWSGFDAQYLSKDIADVQSTRARMSNEVAKLIFLRRVGKKWRHQVNSNKLALAS